jgi:molybdate transport system substrate-binding protein
VKFAQLVLVAISTLACNWTHAAEITVVSTVGVRGLLEQIQGSFEHRSNNRLHVEYGTAAVLKRQLEGGGSFDVAILTRSMIDDLSRQGIVLEGARAVVARSGMGIAAKAGTVKPSIGTHESLRRALLASSGVAFTKEGQSGAAAARLFDSLGIAEPMRDRIDLETRPAGGVLAVAEGKATLGIALMSEIAADSQVELVGPLPDDLQTYVVFGAGMASGTQKPQACRAFIAFLGTQAVGRTLKKLGMETRR